MVRSTTTLDRARSDGVFPVTFHNYSPLGSPAGVPDAVKDWVDLGITVGRTPNFHPDKNRKEEIVAILDRCAEEGIKCFVCDDRASFSNAWKTGEDAYRRDLEAVLKDFGDHPALFGLDAGDEPHGEVMDCAFKTVAIQLEMAPHLTPFLSFGGYSPGGTEWMELRSYRRYLDDFVRIADPPILFHNNGGLCIEAPDATDNFFRDLKMYTDASLRHGNIPLWITLLCAGHFSCRCPSEDDFRWQINAAAAHGFKGFAWFLVYLTVPHANYRVPPFDGFRQRTRTFRWMSRVLRTFHRTHATVLTRLTYRRAFHIGGTYGGYPYTLDSELVKDAAAQFPLIVSEFVDDGGRDYVAVVSNSREGTGQAKITWHGKPELFRVEWGNAEVPARKTVDESDPSKPSTVTEPWFSPGQMALYRVESDAPRVLGSAWPGE
jgi:hypothetical protein